MTRSEPKSRRRNDTLLNTLTILTLLGTLVVGAIDTALFAIPDFVPPALKPPTLPAVVQLPAATPTSEIPTPTPPLTATPRSTLTRTPVPTLTPSPTPTPTPTLTLTLTPGGPTITPTHTLSPLPYTLQGDAPVPLRNFANPEDCNWMGIAGQAFALDGSADIGLIVHLEGGGLSLDALTGSAPAYGEAGYELVLNNHPVETTNTYRVQLLDLTGAPLSDVVVVDTFAECSKNLLLVNFVRNH